MSGGGTMEPIPPPILGQSWTYGAPKRTILPLLTYASVMGINPIQFMSGVAINYFPSSGSTDRWVQYPWQDELKVSRNELADEIYRAERDIAAELRYWPGPVWIEDSEILYPQYYRKGYVGLFGHDANHQMKSVKLTYGNFITGGKRAVSFINTATTAAGSLEYLDLDNDGLYETARITVATSLTNPCEVNVYFADKNGTQEWEIRPLKTRTISGGDFVATVDSWALISPDLLAALPGTLPSGFDPIDAENLNNYVAEVDVYREYTDPSEQCVMLWNGSTNCACGGTGCSVCGFIEQTACLVPGEQITGLTRIVPATYDIGGGTWTGAEFSGGYEPAKVRVSYLSGLNEIDPTTGCVSVPRDIAMAITYMTTARLSRPLCTKSITLRAREKELKEDLIFVQPGGEMTRFITREIMNCPFGTRYGELEAWRIIRSRLKSGELNVDVTVV